MLSDNNLLLRALSLNAAFSGFTALGMFLTAPWLAQQFGLSAVLPVYVVAGFLALFALQLANIVRTRAIRTWEIAGIIGGDIAWVVTSAIVVGFFYESLTAAGFMLLDVVAFAVLLFAILQILGLREYRRTIAANN